MSTRGLKQRICLIVDPTFLALRIKARVRAVAVYIIQPQQLMGFRSRQEPKHPNLTNLLIRRYGGTFYNLQPWPVNQGHGHDRD